MIAAHHTLTELPSTRTLEAVEEVLAMSAEHAALDVVKARMFRFEVRTLTSGKQRWAATRHADPDDPRRADLLALLDALVDDQDGYQTGHGFLTRTVLAEAEGRVEREDGRTCIRFPFVHPWRVRPDDNGFGGDRDEPIYRDVPVDDSEDDAPPPEWWEGAA